MEANGRKVESVLAPNRSSLPYAHLVSPHDYSDTMSTSAHSQKRVAFLFLDFLKSGIADGSIRADDAEGIEVASELDCSTL